VIAWRAEGVPPRTFLGQDPAVAAAAAMGGVASAEDVAQEAFVVAWRSLAQLREPDRVGAWLRGIARTLARAEHRKRARRERGDGGRAVATGDLRLDLDQRERVQMLDRDLAGLAAEDREPLLLFYFENESPDAPDPELLAELPLKDAPGWGPAAAPVQLVAFIDYACPYSKRLVAELDAVRASHPTMLRISIRHRPMGDLGLALARAALAAESMGRFEPMFDQLFARDDIRPADLPALAKAAGLDPVELAQRTESDAVGERLADDVALADTAGVTGTPTMLINGERLLGGRTAEELTRHIEDAARDVAAGR
jgi:protein-disulfide isomerase